MNSPRNQQGPKRNFLHNTATLLCLLLVSIQLDTILSFRVTSSLCSRQFQKFRAGCASTRLLSTTDDTIMTETSNPLSALGLPEPLLLGSASFTRKLILKEMGVPFSKFVRPIDEKALGDRSENAPPRELVLLLGNAKMDRLVQELQENDPQDLPDSQTEGWVVLTGDQVVTCGGKILEKPESEQEAKEFVASYAQNPPSTVGSCVLYHHPSGIRVEGVDTATIHFNAESLGNGGSDKLIDTLIEQGEPVMSCAGGLMVEHPLTKHHIDRIDGTEDSVMGLSKDLVLRLLQELADKLAEKA